MNIVVAPDSFKGSLTSVEASEIMKSAILNVDSGYSVTMKPMADGGEGTLESLLKARNGERIEVDCTGPLGDKVTTSYGIINGKTAVIECANIVGLTQVPENKLNPDNTTTYGIGEVIIHALNKGCESFIIGLGGSSTNDGGLGMLLALGMSAWDKDGNQITGYGRDLYSVERVQFDNLDTRIAKVEINIASDVENPLCGELGATSVFGPQKGASPKQVKQLDEALRHFGNLVESELHVNIQEIPGAGAAGGLGFALMAIGGSLVSGAALVGDAIGIESAIEAAELVVTGEGQSDEQTLYGKAPGYVATIAKKYGVPVVLISGSLNGNLDPLRERFSGCFSIINKPLSLQQCFEKADKLLFEQTKQVVHLAGNIK
ncbi:glycerate kinase [Virgibacillus dakarensis]|uniref:glycerate kinase n=1 Tax=Virgibacillus dakarensis TaxID=1917889 RepID=UPI000B43D694|nr:glycerate kinase [Virgibacillus dakarensis]